MIAPFFVAQIRLWPNLHERGALEDTIHLSSQELA